VDQFFSYLTIGLSVGAIYAFIALGYSMVYGIIRLINFAHGEFFMVGAFAGYFVLKVGAIDRVALPHPWPTVLAYAAAVAAGAAAAGGIALLAEKLCYRPIRRAGRIAALLTAVGLSLLLQNVMRQAVGPSKLEWESPRVFVATPDIPEPADARYYEMRPYRTSAGALIPREEVLVEAGASLSPAERTRLGDSPAGTTYRRISIPPGAAKTAVVLLLVLASWGLFVLVQRTRTGRAMRAVSEDMQAARLMGVDVDRTVAVTFFVGAVIAGIGGVANGVIYGHVEPLMGFLPGLKAFIAAVLGGIGSIPGAILGGLFLGMAETLFGAYVSTEWQDALAFLLLIVVLLVKPTGLLGRPHREKV
jgi:branched-chain amino acid transport system permease protein